MQDLAVVPPLGCIRLQAILSQRMNDILEVIGVEVRATHALPRSRHARVTTERVFRRYPAQFCVKSLLNPLTSVVLAFRPCVDRLRLSR